MLKQKASPESILPQEKEQESIAQLAQILSRESAQPKIDRPILHRLLPMIRWLGHS